jgi:hypothetical protein
MDQQYESGMIDEPRGGGLHERLGYSKKVEGRIQMSIGSQKSGAWIPIEHRNQVVRFRRLSSPPEFRIRIAYRWGLT